MKLQLQLDLYATLKYLPKRKLTLETYKQELNTKIDIHCFNVAIANTIEHMILSNKVI